MMPSINWLVAMNIVWFFLSNGTCNPSWETKSESAKWDAQGHHVFGGFKLLPELYLRLPLIAPLERRALGRRSLACVKVDFRLDSRRRP